MMYLRSLIFNILFYGVTAVLAVLALPAMLLPAAVIQAVARFWGLLTVWLLRIVGATHRVSGELHHGRQVIYAAKHQSAWETIVLSLLLRTPVVVLKRELLKLPLLGWYFRKAGCIAVDRSAGMRALRQLRDDAVAARDAGRSLLIFPQGTSVAPGESRKYEVGIFALYESTGLPVVPIALNSGHMGARTAGQSVPAGSRSSSCPPSRPGWRAATSWPALKRPSRLEWRFSTPHISPQRHWRRTETDMDGSQGRPDGQKTCLAGRCRAVPRTR